MRKNGISRAGTLAAFTFVASSALAQTSDPAASTTTSDSPISLVKFGVTERLTKQTDMNGLNLSTLVSWNPSYTVLDWLSAESQIGFTMMKADVGMFLVSQAQIGLSFHNLLPNHFDAKDVLVPEILVGAENWNTDEGGTFLVGTLNLRYRPLLNTNSIADALDSVSVGYQWMPGLETATRQYTIGARIVPTL